VSIELLVVIYNGFFDANVLLVTMIDNFSSLSFLFRLISYI
jgi:hypothetical protein